MKLFQKFILAGLSAGVALIPASAAPSVKITPVGRLTEILPPGQDFVWTLSLTGLAPGETASWQVLDWDGNAAAPSSALLVQDSGAKIDFKPQRLGWEDLVVSVRGTDGKVSETHRGFVSGETRKLGPDDFKYGICSHLRPNPIYPASLEVLDKLGVVYVRDDFSFGRSEPAEGKWDWTFFDGMVTDLEKRGVQIDAILGFTAKWDSIKPDAPNAERLAPRLDPWLTYVRAMVGRYQGRIRYWEIWNEEDISFWQSPVPDFLQLFSATAKAIKETNPQAVVLNGGFAMISRPPNLTFKDDFLSQVDRSNWDVFAYHDYHSFANLLERRKQVTDVCAKYHLNLPVWMNEGGISAVGLGAERVQAETLVKKLATAPSLGLQSYFVYDLHNDGTDPINGEHNFGLVSFDFAAKPSFGAYQNLVRLLGGRKFLRTEHLENPDVWSQVYAGRDPADDAIAVLWAENLSGGTILAWYEGMKGAHLFDLMGNPVPLVELPKGSLVAIGSEPVYLQAKDITDWRPRPLLVTPPVVPLRVGQITPVSIPFTNPWDQSVQVSVTESKVSAGLHFTMAAPVEIPAGETHPLTIAFQCDPAVAPRPTAQLDVSFSGGHSKISLPLGVVKAFSAVNPAAGSIELSEQEGTPLVFKGAESIINLFAAEPLDDMHWHGPQDLSLTARLGYGDEGMYLTFRVTDDIQSQTNEGNHLELGDSLEVLLAPEASAASYLDLTLALDKTGHATGWVGGVPANSTIQPGALSLASIPCVVHREGTVTVYALKIPWSVLGLAQVPKEPFRLSFLVNDDDGKGRKQWLVSSRGLAPGRNPQLFPFFICP